MYIPKRYGESKTIICPFCSKQALSKNKQKIPVCQTHVNELIPEIKCVCGSYLELREGKFGPFFTCINCGAINFNKGMEMLEQNKYKTQNTKDIKEKNPKSNSNKSFQQKVPVDKIQKKDGFILDSGKYDDFDYGID